MTEEKYNELIKEIDIFNKQYDSSVYTNPGWNDVTLKDVAKQLRRIGELVLMREKNFMRAGEMIKKRIKNG
jgi:hypothetical protein